MNKIVFMDIDGTFLDEEKRIPDSAAKAIKETVAAGNICFMCSGRNLAQVNTFWDLGFEGAILLNGSVIVHENKIIYKQVFPEKKAEELLRYAARIGAGVHVLCLNEIYSNEDWNRQKKRFLQESFRDISREAMAKRARPDTPLRNYQGEDIYKIDVRFPSPEDREEYHKNLDPALNMFIDSGYYSRGGTYYAEINPVSASKGEAVRMILDRLNLKKGDAYGFGDSNNDISMLEACGTRIVVASAAPGVLKYADYITDEPSKDGIYKAIELFKLNRKEKS